MEVIGIFHKKNRYTFIEIKEIISLIPFSLNQNQVIQNVQGFQMLYSKLMVSYNILISSFYVIYSIFKEERPDFRYNKVSMSVNLQEISLTKFCLYILNANVILVIVTQEIAGSSVYSG